MMQHDGCNNDLATLSASKLPKRSEKCIINLPKTNEGHIECHLVQPWHMAPFQINHKLALSPSPGNLLILSPHQFNALHILPQMQLVRRQPWCEELGGRDMSTDQGLQYHLFDAANIYSIPAVLLPLLLGGFSFPENIGHCRPSFGKVENARHFKPPTISSLTMYPSFPYHFMTKSPYLLVEYHHFMDRF